MTITIYLLVETEYASSGNYTSILEAYVTKAKAESDRDEQRKKQANFKERHPDLDSCVDYDIQETIMEEKL
jgi:hypothetical protein